MGRHLTLYVRLRRVDAPQSLAARGGRAAAAVAASAVAVVLDRTARRRPADVAAGTEDVLRRRPLRARDAASATAAAALDERARRVPLPGPARRAGARSRRGPRPARARRRRRAGRGPGDDPGGRQERASGRWPSTGGDALEVELRAEPFVAGDGRRLGRSCSTGCGPPRGADRGRRAARRRVRRRRLLVVAASALVGRRPPLAARGRLRAAASRWAGARALAARASCARPTRRASRPAVRWRGLAALRGGAVVRAALARGVGAGPSSRCSSRCLVQGIAATSPVMVVSDAVFHANKLAARGAAGDLFPTSVTPSTRRRSASRTASPSTRSWRPWRGGRRRRRARARGARPSRAWPRRPRSSAAGVVGRSPRPPLARVMPRSSCRCTFDVLLVRQPVERVRPGRDRCLLRLVGGPRPRRVACCSVRLAARGGRARPPSPAIVVVVWSAPRLRVVARRARQAATAALSAPSLAGLARRRATTPLRAPGDRRSSRGCSRARGQRRVAGIARRRGGRGATALGQWGLPAVLPGLRSGAPRGGRPGDRDLAACWLRGRGAGRRSPLVSPLEVRYLYALDAAAGRRRRPGVGARSWRAAPGGAVAGRRSCCSGRRPWRCQGVVEAVLLRYRPEGVTSFHRGVAVDVTAGEGGGWYSPSADDERPLRKVSAPPTPRAASSRSSSGAVLLPSLALSVRLLQLRAEAGREPAERAR